MSTEALISHQHHMRHMKHMINIINNTILSISTTLTHSFLSKRSSQVEVSFNAQFLPLRHQTPKARTQDDVKGQQGIKQVKHTNNTPPYSLNICTTSIEGKLRYIHAKDQYFLLYLYHVAVYFPSWEFNSRRLLHTCAWSFILPFLVAKTPNLEQVIVLWHKMKLLF